MIEESVWLRCFWEIYEAAKRDGKQMIEFADVDKLVLERCRLPLKEFVAWLYVTA